MEHQHALLKLLHSLPSPNALRCLPPLAEREARNFQNFFPFPNLLKEEEALDAGASFLESILIEPNDSDHLEDLVPAADLEN